MGLHDIIGLHGRRYKLRWSLNQEEDGVLVKEELYDKDIEVRRLNDRVISLVIVFEEVLRVVCFTKLKFD